MDYYVELSNKTKSNLGHLKEALQEYEAGPPSRFNQLNQSPGEKVKDFASMLKHLFKNTYLEESVLLQRFLTGLGPEIARQLLLCNRPENFADALKDAVEIEYALQFDGSGNAIHRVDQGKRQSEHVNGATPSQIFEALTKTLQSLQTTLQKN